MLRFEKHRSGISTYVPKSSMYTQHTYHNKATIEPVGFAGTRKMTEQFLCSYPPSNKPENLSGNVNHERQKHCLKNE